MDGRTPAQFSDIRVARPSAPGSSVGGPQGAGRRTAWATALLQGSFAAVGAAETCANSRLDFHGELLLLPWTYS